MADIKHLRQEYMRIFRRSHCDDPAKFKAAVMAYLAHRGVDEPSPQDYVDAARRVQFTCRRCAGTGAFVTMVLNGRPTGPGGICFRCGGKGHRNDQDERRNWGYDIHQPVY